MVKSTSLQEKTFSVSLSLGSFLVLQALEDTYICLRVSQYSVLPGPGKILL